MVRHFFTKFRSAQAGTTAVEYGLVAALMVIAIISGITAVGDSTSNNFDSAAEGFPQDS